MVLTTLLRSRLAQQVAQPAMVRCFATAGRCTMQTAPRITASAPLASKHFAGALSPAFSGAARGFAAGYRRETQVGKGRFWIFMWIIGAAIAAGFMEEVVGPMVLFHS
eukprot:TRINITY_DN8639_c0_g1_i1.p1 TRINITY_DN8639_c0_g1~~TRINITY_DN8639_c0_g1_i1.p1  ORF type:complete len:108 (-),score=20.18 TRINITY_DN8639_c0_g1_i1:158-481(-)